MAVAKSKTRRLVKKVPKIPVETRSNTLPAPPSDALDALYDIAHAFEAFEHLLCVSDDQEGRRYGKLWYLIREHVYRLRSTKEAIDKFFDAYDATRRALAIDTED